MELSIIVPVYNHLDLTQQVIKNIKETQSDIDYELIIVNDGSTDGTEERLKKNKEKNWVVINQENKGTNEAWNAWVKSAKWKYLAIINNDIIMPKWALKKLLEPFKDKSVMMVCPRTTTLKVKDYGEKPFYLKYHIHWRCYVLDSRAKDILFPIDNRLRIFGGDNRLYYKMLYLGYKYVLKHDVIIHHMESQTVDVRNNKDRPIFFNIMKEEWWYVFPFELKNDAPVSDLIFSLY